MTPDAAMAMGIGAPCTTMTPGGQGTCPTGYTCLQLNGGTGAWCSKTCMQGSADQCPVGYTGPGVARCIYNITFQGSGSGTGSSALFCGVICADTTNTCGSACNGTCPGALQCTRPLMSGSGATVGSACF